MRRPDRTDWLLLAATVVTLILIALVVRQWPDEPGCRPTVEGPPGAPLCPDGVQP